MNGNVLTARKHINHTLLSIHTIKSNIRDNPQKYMISQFHWKIFVLIAVARAKTKKIFHWNLSQKINIKIKMRIISRDEITNVTVYGQFRYETHFYGQFKCKIGPKISWNLIPNNIYDFLANLGHQKNQDNIVIRNYLDSQIDPLIHMQ